MLEKKHLKGLIKFIENAEMTTASYDGLEDVLREVKDRLEGMIINFLWKKRIIVIISKTAWKELLAGEREVISTYEDSDLHYYFGDHPEEDIVRVEINERSGKK